MTDHQKAVCWDTLRKQLENGFQTTGAAVLESMRNMEIVMRRTNTVVQSVRAEVKDNK